MIIEIRNYRISPYSGNTCWKVQKKQEKEGAKGEWLEPYYYPGTLDRALELVFELILREDKKELKNLQKVYKEMKDIIKEFREVVDDLNIKYPSDIPK